MAIFPVSSKKRPKENQRKSGSGINACPFAGNAQPHTDAAGAQGKQGLPQRSVIKAQFTVLVHKIVHQYHKKGDIDVNGGDPCLGEVHEVKGKHHTGKGGDGSALGNPPCKEIDKRHHGDAKQGAHDTPAKGIHAKDQYSQGDKYFAQGRVGVLIGGQTVQKFVSGATVIDFVKIHAVAEAAYPGVQLRLVEQLGIPVCIDRRYHVPVRVSEGHFQNGCLRVPEGQAQNGNSCLNAYILPGKDVAQLDFAQGDPFVPGISFSLQPEGPVVPGGGIVGEGAGNRGAEIQFDGLTIGHVIGGGGSLSITQVIQRKAAVGKSNGQHEEKVCAL